MIGIVNLLLAASISTFPRPDADMPHFSESAASVDNALAGYVNPAGLAPQSVMAFRYMHAFTDTTFKGDDGVMLATHGVFVSLEWLNHTNDIFRRKYLMASGTRLFKDFYWGLSYAWFGAASEVYRKKQVFKLGFQYIPSRNLAFGLVVDDLNRPRFGDFQSDRLYTLAAAVFTKQKEIMFSIDAFVDEGQGFSRSNALFRIEVRPSSKFVLAGDYRTEGFLRIGVRYLLEYIDVGIVGQFFESDLKGGTIHYSQGPVPIRRGSSGVY